MAGQPRSRRARKALIIMGLVVLSTPLFYMWIGLPALFTVAIILLSLIVPLIQALIGDARERRVFKELASSDIHGAAKWATEEDIRNAGYSGHFGGVFLGARMCFPDQGHLLTVGGARSGKGNQVIQTLLHDSYEGSVVVLDPKGEIAAVTAAYQQSLGRQVHILDPWGIQANIGADHGITPAQFNPLSILDPGDDNLPDDCDMMAEMLVPINPKKEDHWSVSARQWISGYLLHMMTSFEPERQNLSALRGLFRMLLDSQDSSEETTLNLLLEMKHAENDFADILKENANEMMN